jgi:hypothetical protein
MHDRGARVDLVSRRPKLERARFRSVATPLTSTSVFFASDPKRLRTPLVPERETAMRAVIASQRLHALAATVVAWRAHRRSGGERPALPIAATVLLAIDLATGIRQQLIDLDELLQTLRGRAVNEEWTLSELELRRVALQLYAHPERAPDPRAEPSLLSTGARFVTRCLIGSASLPGRAVAAADAAEIGGQRPAR